MLPRAGWFLGCLLSVAAVAGEIAPDSMDRGLAAQFFQEAKALSDRDGGKLWGRSVYGPMLFVDRASRSVIANGPDTDRTLQRSGDMWEGELPAAMFIANTAVEWSGLRWTMVGWPLPESRHARASLMLHECFHRIQKELGLDLSDRPCGHLDSKEGRIWLQLEWRALGEALLARGPTRRRAIQDALLFRAYRRSLFPGAAELERNLELKEGLAEYTGIRLSARSEAQAIADALGGLDLGVRKPTFVRSFAYASGPAYGLLLDRSAPGWRHHMKEGPDLGDLLLKALAIRMAAPEKSQALGRAAGYGIEELVQDETQRDYRRKLRVARFQASLVEGPVLTLPRTEAIKYSFNPNELLPLEQGSIAYPTLQANDIWGALDVTEGALLTPGDLRVSAPEHPISDPLRGRGWTLTLKPGWRLVPDSRKGDWRLVQEAAPSAPGEPSR
ncbi:hypothetical protein [Geothrix sp. 21YS21S-4]|uniref:hypothetical protein n=1 Tax=Geothrix sp. 21YS21S-4 TaxID=3068889 RepID=UPI0027B9A1F4|nr:hypothetical protein [Geothrix sp. 21YS21S-4]